MATTAFAEDTQAATVTTEHFVADANVAGVFTFHVDCNAMVAGDVLELRVYQMVLTSGTARAIWTAQYHGAQQADADGLIKVSVPIGNELTDATSLRFSIKQTFGTSRNFPWKVLKYA
jgi:hypothetical protein